MWASQSKTGNDFVSRPVVSAAVVAEAVVSLIIPSERGIGVADHDPIHRRAPQTLRRPRPSCAAQAQAIRMRMRTSSGGLMATAAVPQPKTSVTRTLVAILLTGAAVSVGLGVYANEHTPTGEKPYDLFFSTTINLKVWFATAVIVLACIQVLLALRLYGKVHWPARAPAWLGDAHRLVGIVAFGLSLPIAYHCLWSLGWQSTTTRVVIHSLLGCIFYGAFTVKVLCVRVHSLPGWALPVAGGVVFAVLVGLFLTSS